MVIRDKIFTKLNSYGWAEECPSETKWIFSKKNWICTLDWICGIVTFVRR